jgi:hypothetical protein
VEGLYRGLCIWGLLEEGNAISIFLSSTMVAWELDVVWFGDVKVEE